MKKISTILIIVGLLIMAYPIISDVYEHYWSKQLVEELEVIEQEEILAYDIEGETVDVVPLSQAPIRDDVVIDYDKLQTFFEDQYEREGAQEAPLEIAPPEPDSLIGKILIPKINLEMALLEGATNANMKKGGGHMTGTSEFGEIGNAAIAAHRSYTYGRFFNRLDELEVGDTFTIETDYGKFFYQVYHIKVVEPTDLSVLNRNDTDKVVTLITCTPIRVASHRLIIHAVQLN